VDAAGAVGIEAAEAVGSYYAVSSVDGNGDESAQTLGISPSALASAIGGGGAGGAAAGCFVSTVGGSVPAGLFWVLAIFTIAVVAAHWRTVKKHGA